MNNTPEINKVLNRTAEILEQGWCQDHSAKDINGFKCIYNEDIAVQWCIQGAVGLAINQLGIKIHTAIIYQRIVKQLKFPRYDPFYYPQCIEYYNDAPERTQEEVVQLIRSCITEE